MLGAGWTEAVALVAAFAVATLATPAGISGAVLLLPFQVGVLGTPSPAVTPTNLLYNVVATPGALYRYRRQGQTGGRLAVILASGTLPGVVAGSIIRVELLPGAMAFDLVIAAVLIPLGAWLAVSRPPVATALTGSASAEPGSGGPAPPARTIPTPVLVALAAVVGCIGGIYGIGGGSILAPILIAAGRPASRVAPAALASTFVTSVAGVITFAVLSLHQHGSVAPDWSTGIALGAGGLVGAYTGARFQSRLPDLVIRRLIGALVIATGIRYLWSGLDRLSHALSGSVPNVGRPARSAPDRAARRARGRCHSADAMRGTRGPAAVRAAAGAGPDQDRPPLSAWWTRGL